MPERVDEVPLGYPNTTLNMNTLTEETLKKWEEFNKDFWPSDFLSAGDVSTLISTAREVSRLREAAMGVRKLLGSAMIGSCSCLTKTPKIQFHDENCRYRLIAESLNLLGKSEGPSTASGDVVPAHSDA